MYRAFSFFLTASTSGSADAPGMPKYRVIPHAASSATSTSATVMVAPSKVVFFIRLHLFLFVNPHKRPLPHGAAGTPPIVREVLKERARGYAGGRVSGLLIILVITDTAHPSRHTAHVPMATPAVPHLHI